MGGIFELVSKRAGFLALYLFAAVVGRATVVDGSSLALVWPAAGVAVAWLITQPTRQDLAVDLPLITIIGVVLSLMSGRSSLDTFVIVMSNLVAVLTTVLAARAWSPAGEAPGSTPTRSPQDVAWFLAAIAAGSTAGVGAGALGFWLIGHEVSAAELVVWLGRNVCGITAVGITTLLIVERVRLGRHAAVFAGRWGEMGLLFAATGALVVADYLSPLPLTFLLPAVAVWAGSRFPALAVAAQALVGGAGILWLTYAEQGPFSALGTGRTSILLAQLFTAMTLTIGLVLAAAREARSALQADLISQEREQSAELLTFARRAAHDLRNPLTVIESWAAELDRTLSAVPAGPAIPLPDTSLMITKIQDATARMRTLVDALLADAAARDRATSHLPVDLPELVAEVASEYGAEEHVRSLGVRTVAGDPVLLRQLVENVVANALKYVRPGEQPDITVSAHHTSDRVVVRVADNGIGIPPGAHEWIFEPFRRAHEGSYPGTGLGLSTCRRIVERHGGSMRALSREDGPGAVFEFDLPKTPKTMVSAGTRGEAR